MKRTQMYLTDVQKRAIAQRASDLGLSQAEVIRRILDEALCLRDEEQRLRDFQSTFGALKGKGYPGWEEWLREVRGPGINERMAQIDRAIEERRREREREHE